MRDLRKIKIWIQKHKEKIDPENCFDKNFPEYSDGMIKSIIHSSDCYDEDSNDSTNEKTNKYTVDDLITKSNQNNNQNKTEKFHNMNKKSRLVSENSEVEIE